MHKFYQRWQFWLYLVVVMSNIIEITYRKPFNMSNWQSWLSVGIILLFSYNIYDEIKQPSASEQK